MGAWAGVYVCISGGGEVWTGKGRVCHGEKGRRGGGCGRVWVDNGEGDDDDSDNDSDSDDERPVNFDSDGLGYTRLYWGWGEKVGGKGGREERTRG